MVAVMSRRFLGFHATYHLCEFTGLTIQANMYYKLLIGWTSQKVKDTFATRNAFDFKHGNNY